MKRIAFLFPIMFIVAGCTQRSALERQLDLSEAKTREMASEVNHLREQNATCQKAMTMLNNFKSELSDDYDKASDWISTKMKEGEKK
jgi:hypothetical protein